MTEVQAKAKFDRLCNDLHESGYDVLAVISKRHEQGGESVHRSLLHGKDEHERAQAFFRCHRAFRDELARSTVLEWGAPPVNGAIPRGSRYESVKELYAAISGEGETPAAEPSKVCVREAAKLSGIQPTVPA